VSNELGFYIPEDGVLHNHCRENLKSHIDREHSYKFHMKHSCPYKITNLAMPRKCMGVVICSSRNYSPTKQWGKGRRWRKEEPVDTRGTAKEVIRQGQDPGAAT
jgi:hypothetical protein